MNALRVMRLLAAALWLAGLLLGAAGCMSTPSGDSDLPWNTPPAWEGVPSIPGMNY